MKAVPGGARGKERESRCDEAVMLTDIIERSSIVGLIQVRVAATVFGVPEPGPSVATGDVIIKPAGGARALASVSGVTLRLT